MTKALLKNTLREIRDTKARFISILMIVALGVGFFVGVKATSPSMKQMATDYYDNTNLMDFRLVSTIGFDDYDINAIKTTAGVASIMPSHYADVMVNSGGTGSIIRLMGTPYKYKTNEVLNNPVVIEGHLPEKKGEIAVENGNFSNYKIGDTIEVEPTVGDTDTTDLVNTLKYKVVGIVQSPMYISFERGTTTVGNGKVSGYAFISNDTFATERFTEVYVTIRTGDDDKSPFTDDYSDTIEEITKRLEKTSDERISVFVRDNIESAQKKIDENTKQLNEEKKTAEKSLSDAKNQIDTAEKEYQQSVSSAQSQIDSAQEQIDSGIAQLDSQKSQYQSSVSSFNSQISASKAQIENSKKEYKKQYDEFYNKTKPNLESAAKELEDGIVATATGTIYGISSLIPSQLIPGVAEQLNSIAANVTASNAKQSLESVKQIISDIDIGGLTPDYPMPTQYAPDTSESDNSGEQTDDDIDSDNNYDYSGSGDFIGAVDFSVDTLISTIDTSIQTIEELQGNLDSVNNGISQGKAKLAQAKKTLDTAQAKITKTESETKSKLNSYKTQLDDAESQLYSSQSTVSQSQSQLNETKASTQDTLNKSKSEYNKSKKETEDKFNSAEKKLIDAQKKLDELEEPSWYLFDREDNPGYSTFSENSNRVDAVAAVFPVFFLLVALLVCLTTMTRLVEEKRTQIGTLKALGYDNKSIIAKFVIYSSTAALLGCIIGCSLGIPILPRVIYNAYKMMYSMQDIDISMPWGNLALAIFAAFFCCAFVSFVVCYKTLRQKSSALMRPKAPKPGKRVLLERITPLWRRFSFTSKVTGRNLFRYKSRLMMTVIGIAGCTALILSAFGLYDSISDVVDIQYKDLCSYNTIIVTNGEGDHNKFKSLMNDIETDSRISDNMLVMQKMMTVVSDTKTVSEEVYITVPEDETAIDNLIKLRERTTHRSIHLQDGQVVLTEKLADMLGVSKGDNVYLSDNKKSVVVSDICENYVYNYIYATSNTYKDLFGENAKYNMVLLKAKDISDETEKELGTDYLDHDDVSAISFMSTGIKSFNDMINSMNLVIVVMIVCAGALAVVVLYNLTNINLAERNREIATIKVLGFNHRETSSFLYRENIVMTILGILAGLGIGIWLANYMIVTIEVDSVMFGRTIHAPSFLYAAVGTAFFSLLVNFIMHFKIKKINMVESLKSIE